MRITPTSHGSVAVDNTAAFTLQKEAVWELADYNNDGKLDLIYIQNRSSNSGKLEIIAVSGASNFQSYLVQNAQTVFNAQVHGRWQMLDVDGDGTLNLVCIQNSNTASNYAEVFVASGAPNHVTITSQTVSSLSISNGGTGLLANWNTAGSYDLFSIRNINTASGYVEVNVASATSGYQTILQSVPTTFSTKN